MKSFPALAGITLASTTIINLVLAASSNTTGVFDQTFTLIAARSASPIHLQAINATGGGLWIGKPQATYCPNATAEGIPIPCPQSSQTIFTGPDEETHGIALDVDVPGGQMLYIDPTCGAVRYTTAHSEEEPAGALTGGWTLDQLASFGELAYVNGTVFCPETGSVQDPDLKTAWQMFAALDGLNFTNCLGADLLTTNATGPGAWEYSA
ncbi:Hypothetical predicted protein [Lecanosticta acicola]|uniref:Uncharacterized protein n=1 Tax=Lecanosticta acicola TaxID=111012 RepID=A0AAI9ECY3_9PEZI|nr:Hypothetical predicted protein [Lecanosticta acicola]